MNKKKKCPAETKKSKSGKTCRRIIKKKSVKKPRIKWWGRSYGF